MTGSLSFTENFRTAEWATFLRTSHSRPKLDKTMLVASFPSNISSNSPNDGRPANSTLVIAKTFRMVQLTFQRILCEKGRIG